MKWIYWREEKRTRRNLWWGPTTRSEDKKEAGRIEDNEQKKIMRWMSWRKNNKRSRSGRL